MDGISHHVDLIPGMPLDAERTGVISSNRCLTARSKETVYLIHEDLRFCQTLSTLLASSGIAVLSFSSCADCLEHGKLREAGCLVLDLQLHNSGGASLRQWIDPELCRPIIFISDHRDVAAAVHAMKMGAIEVFTKSVDPAVVVEAIHIALVQNRKLRLRKAELEKLKTRYSLLSPRERDVVPLIVGGLLNKQAASVLGIAMVTLQVHRRQVMRKMEAESLADLVRMAMKLRIPYWRSGYSCAASAIQSALLSKRMKVRFSRRCVIE